MPHQENVIIIGADHHNTLAVVRCLGQNKCSFELLVLTSDITKKIRITHSKYVKNYTVIEENEKKILSFLESRKTTGKKKALIPCSDFAELIIDSNAAKLCDAYIIPGFQNHFGRVAYLMNKFHQKEFAEEHNIPMAKSWKVSLVNGHFRVPDDIVFPCIIKPLVSACGNKSDIVIVKKTCELSQALLSFEVKKYTEILIQEFLIKKYECCAFGCIVSGQEKYFGGIVRKIREAPPPGGGSTAFAQHTNNESIKLFVNKIQTVLFNESYSGLYDIEFFICDNGLFLNEINFRHSGVGYAIINKGIPAPYIWYLSIYGKDISMYPHSLARRSFYTNELYEILNLKIGRLGFFNFIRSFCISTSYAVFSLTDLRGTWGFYHPLFISAIKKGLKIISCK